MYSATGTQLSLLQLLNSYSSVKSLFRVTSSRKEASSETLQIGLRAHFTLGEDTANKVLWGAVTCRNSNGGGVKLLRGGFLEEEVGLELSLKGDILAGGDAVEGTG